MIVTQTSYSLTLVRLVVSRLSEVVVDYPTNKRQEVTVKAFATYVIAISSTDPARLPVLQVGRYSSLSNG